MKLLLVMLALVASPAFAYDFYVGGAVGQVAVDAGSSEHTALDYGGFIGWQAHKHFALEAAYLDLDHGSTVDLDMVASHALPVTKGLEVYGKVGVSFLNLDSVTQTTGNKHHKVTVTTFDGSQQSLNYGFGVGYAEKHLRVRAGLEWIAADGLSALRLSNLAVAYKF